MVYFIPDEASGLVKIGYTDRRVFVRLANLRSGNPGKLTLIGVVPGGAARQLETYGIALE